MKKQLFSLLILALPLISSAQLTVSDSVDVFVKGRIKQLNIPALQLAVIRNGQIVKLNAYGTANLENNIPATDQSIFSINSITKAFVGVAVMQLQEEGKLNVNDPLSKYLNELPEAWKNVTIQQVLTHTSGMPDIVDEDEDLFKGGEEVAWKRMTGLPMQFKTGERFSYNQAGYVAIGKIINKLTGMHFTKFIAERQFIPAGMVNTRFGDSYDVVPNSAGAYTMTKLVDGQFKRMESPGIAYIQFPEFYRTAAGILSTAKDMGNWIIALKSGKLLKKQSSIDQMWTPAILNNGKIGGFSALTNGYALGWPTVTRPEHPAVGPVGGGRNGLFIYLKDDLSIVVLTNLMGANPERFIDEIGGYYINDLHEANGFGLPPAIKNLKSELSKIGYNKAIGTVANLKKNNPKIDLNEDDINAFGYRLFRQQEAKNALEIFKLNVSLYPKSANAYDSLAEAFEALEDKTNALINYKKSLALNPDNKNAAERIKALEN